MVDSLQNPNLKDRTIGLTKSTVADKLYSALYWGVFMLASLLWPVSIPAWLILTRGERFDVALVAFVPGFVTYVALGYYYWLLLGS